MPTLTRVDHRRIVCKTILAERLFGFMLAGCGTLFVIVSLYALALRPMNSSDLLFFVSFILISLAIIVVGMTHFGGLKASGW